MFYNSSSKTDERCQGVQDIIKFIKTEFQEGGHMTNVTYLFKSASKRILLKLLVMAR